MRNSEYLKLWHIILYSFVIIKKNSLKNINKDGKKAVLSMQVTLVWLKSRKQLQQFLPKNFSCS